MCVCEPHRGTRVNIPLENGQYPHRPSYEAPCLPWGATRESGQWDPGGWVGAYLRLWLPLWPGVHYRRVVKFGPTWSIGWSRQAQELKTLFCLHCHETNIVWYTFIYYALGAVARVNLVINYFYCLSISTMYPWHECLLDIRSIMSPCWTRWRLGAWLMNLCHTNMTKNKLKKKLRWDHEKGPHRSFGLFIIWVSVYVTVPKVPCDQFIWRRGLEEVITFC